MASGERPACGGYTLSECTNFVAHRRVFSTALVTLPSAILFRQLRGLETEVIGQFQTLFGIRHELRLFLPDPRIPNSTPQFPSSIRPPWPLRQVHPASARRMDRFRCRSVLSHPYTHKPNLNGWLQDDIQNTRYDIASDIRDLLFTSRTFWVPGRPTLRQRTASGYTTWTS